MLSQSRGKLFSDKGGGAHKEAPGTHKKSKGPVIIIFFLGGKNKGKNVGSQSSPIWDYRTLQDSSPTRIPTAASIPVGA